MTGLNFPANPNVGDTYSIGNRTWSWNGVAWQLQSGIVSTNPFTVITEIITTTTNSTGTNTGALIVGGGAGFNGDIHANTIYANNAIVVTTATIGDIAGLVFGIVGGTDTSVSTSTGEVTIWNTSTLQTVTSRGSITNNPITITNNSVSTSTQTGALVVTGGVGISGTLYAGNNVSISGSIISVSNVAVTCTVTATNINSSILNVSTTGTISSVFVTSTASSTSTNTGALQVLGGVGITGNLYIGGNLYTNGQVVLTTASLISHISGGVDIEVITTGTGTISINDISTLQSVTSRGSSSTQAIVITNQTPSTSTLTGALLVSGGVGIGDDLNVGGSLTVTRQICDPPENIVNTIQVTLDSFSTSTYRSAKYFISVSNPALNIYQTSEIWLVHDNVSAQLEETTVYSSGMNIVDFDADITSGTVSLVVTGDNVGNIIKMQSTYITV